MWIDPSDLTPKGAVVAWNVFSIVWYVTLALPVYRCFIQWYLWSASVQSHYLGSPDERGAIIVHPSFFHGGSWSAYPYFRCRGGSAHTSNFFECPFRLLATSMYTFLRAPSMHSRAPRYDWTRELSTCCTELAMGERGYRKRKPF